MIEYSQTLALCWFLEGCSESRLCRCSGSVVFRLFYSQQASKLKQGTPIPAAEKTAAVREVVMIVEIRVWFLLSLSVNTPRNVKNQIQTGSPPT